MLTDVNLVICFSCKHFTYPGFKTLKITSFPKRPDVTIRSLKNDCLPFFSSATISKTLNLFHFINADLFCLNSHRLLFAFQIPQVTPVAFSKTVNQQRKQQMALCASGLNKAQNEYIVQGGWASWSVHTRRPSNSLSISPAEWVSYRHTTQELLGWSVCCGERTNAENTWGWLTAPYFGWKAGSLWSLTARSTGSLAH